MRRRDKEAGHRADVSVLNVKTIVEGGHSRGIEMW